MISIDDFAKVEMRIGRILSAQKVPDTDKLLHLLVDFGEEAPRSVVSGIAEYFPLPEVLVGKKCPFITNLEVRIIKNIKSEAMILAIRSKDNAFSLLEPTGESIPEGTILH